MGNFSFLTLLLFYIPSSSPRTLEKVIPNHLRPVRFLPRLFRSLVPQCLRFFLNEIPPPSPVVSVYDDSQSIKLRVRTR